MQMAKPLTHDEVKGVFRRIFNGGEMRRLPKSRKDTEAVLALAVASLDPRATYSVAEVNEGLSEWMAGFVDPATMDHVTLRRCMVDIFMLLRDPHGRSYRTNQTVINQVIEPEARAVQPLLVMNEVAAERTKRKAQTVND